MWLTISSFFLLPLLVFVFSLPHFLPPRSLPSLISVSLHKAGLWSLEFQLLGEMNAQYLFLFSPLCFCCFSAVCNGQRGEQRLYSSSALGTWACNLWSMQGRGGKENTEAQIQTERCDIVRLKQQEGADRKCNTDGVRVQTDIQTGEGNDG